MLFALAFIVTFVNGGLTGLFLGNVVVDVPLSDTMFVVAHFHMVMGVAPSSSSSEPSITGTRKSRGGCSNEALGKFTSGSRFLEPMRSFSPCIILGLMGVPRRYHEIGEMAFVPPTAHTLNAFITIVALVVGAAQIVFFFNLIWSLRNGKPAGEQSVGSGEPWSGKRPKRRRRMAIGAGNFLWSIAGPTITAYLVRRRISCRRTSLSFRMRRMKPDEQHHPLPGDNRRHWRLVAVQAGTDGETLAGGRCRGDFLEQSNRAFPQSRSDSVFSLLSSARCSRCLSAPMRCAWRWLIGVPSRAKRCCGRYRYVDYEQCRTRVGENGRAARGFRRRGIRPDGSRAVHACFRLRSTSRVAAVDAIADFCSPAIRQTPSSFSS